MTTKKIKRIAADTDAAMLWKNPQKYVWYLSQQNIFIHPERFADKTESPLILIKHSSPIRGVFLSHFT